MQQAQHDLQVATHDFDGGFYSDACFMGEQAAQKALKAFLILQTGRSLFGEHSIQTLARRALAYDEAFGAVVGYGRILDRYYVPTRYPDALAPPAVPFETYTQADAESALELAGQIVALCQGQFARPG